MTTLEFIVNKFKLQSFGPGTLIPGSRNKELLDLFRELGFTSGAEVGVETGVYSEIICKNIPGIHLNCIDPWKVYPGYRDHLDQKYLNGLYHTTRKRLKPYSCNIIRDFSENAYKQFPDASLDFVYVDGNHDFLHVTQDIALWSTKVKKDGIIAGHDFKRIEASKYRTTNNVKDVIPAYAYGAGITSWFVMKGPSETASWFWVNA